MLHHTQGQNEDASYRGVVPKGAMASPDYAHLFTTGTPDFIRPTDGPVKINRKYGYIITKNSTFIEKSLQSMTCWLVRRHTIKSCSHFSGEAKLKQLQKCHFNIVVRDYVITIRQNHLFFGRIIFNHFSFHF